MEDIQKFIYINDLLARYGELLTAKQLEMMKLYYHLNLSLQEISEECGVSRAAVSDSLKKATRHLEKYESVIQLEKKNRHLKTLLTTLKEENLSVQQQQIIAEIEKEL